MPQDVIVDGRAPRVPGDGQRVYLPVGGNVLGERPPRHSHARECLGSWQAVNDARLGAKLRSRREATEVSFRHSTRRRDAVAIMTPPTAARAGPSGPGRAGR